MRPTAEDFRSFCHNAGCTVSHRNGNIADTLEALKRYDRHLETLRHMPEAAPHEEDETRKTRQQLQRQLLLVSMKGWVTNCHYQNRAGFAISVLLRI